MNKLKELFSCAVGMNFIGAFNELPSNGKLGDYCVVNDKIYVYGLEWYEMGTVLPSGESIKIINKTLYLT